MKPFKIWLTALLFLLITPFSGLADFNKTKIAVLDFHLQGDSFENADLGLIVAEWGIALRVRVGRFDVVERRLLQKILSEQQLAMSGVIDASSATQLGKLLGVKVIISGSVMKLRNTIEINARIIDVESASIIAAESVKSSATNRLQDLVVDMSRKIMKNFPLEGYIVNRKGEMVTLDLGIRTGVKAGMKFIVFKEGQVIKHPKTGEVLDVEKIETGTITITEVRKNICKAKIDEEASPGSINYGQLVKSLSDNSKTESRLFVNSIPVDAIIKVLNIGPRYESGMVLTPGAYHIEVSAKGYVKQRDWINISSGEQKSISFTLSPEANTFSTVDTTISTENYSLPAPPITDIRTSLSAQNIKYVKALQSNDLHGKREAAKQITRARLSNTAVLDILEDELLKGYQKNQSDRTQIDTMAWFCKALGASGVSSYRSSLEKIVATTPNRKLRRYCKKSLDKL